MESDNSALIAAEKSKPAPQFGLMSLFWTVLVICIALAYLRQFRSTGVFLTGTMLVIAAILVGSLVGWWAGRLGDALYWSVMLAVAAFLSVAGERSYGPIFPIAWSAVGITAGAAGGAVAQQRLIRRILACALVAGVTMLAFSPGIRAGTIELVFDMICAPIIGGLIAVLIEIILWLERTSEIPRYITASWLLCAVIIGNWLVPLVRA